MDPALWLLLRLRFWSWLRRLGRNLGSVKGLVLMVLGALVFGGWILAAFQGRPPITEEHLASVRRWGTLILLAYLLLTVATTAGERAISFSPAEVNFLFPGPFSRRQLLAYKIAGTFGVSLLSAGFMTVAFRGSAPSALAAFVALVLTLLFAQLLGLAAALVSNIVGAQAYSRGRQVVLLAVGLALAAGALQLGREALLMGYSELLARLDQTPAWQVVLAPLRWFVLAYTAQRPWPDLVQWSALGLLVDSLMLLLVFRLDAQYLESAAAAGEKVYNALQRIRGGGGVVTTVPKQARYRLPDFPWWGGVGPVAWRQFQSALRQIRLPIMVFVFSLAIGVPAALAARDETGSGAAVGILASLVGVMAWAFPMMMPFDFRADLDRMDVLKTLPIAAWRLALGQLLAPVLLFTLVLWGDLVVFQVILRRVETVLLLAAGFAVPFHFLLFGLENVLFLWFPRRLTPGAGMDLQAMGRQVLIIFLKFLILGMVGGVAALAGVLAYGLAGLVGNHPWAAALAAAWLTLAGVGAALVPLVGHAFRQFDVARDTPP